MMVELLSAMCALAVCETWAAADPSPAILLSTTTNRASLGSRVVLNADPGGAFLEASYQWRFGSNNLAGATNATLILEQVQTNQAGIYHAQIIDDKGSIFEAERTVLIGPVFTRISTEPFSAGGGAQALAWGDFNQDGWIDVFCATRSRAATSLFTNDTHGSFGLSVGKVGANLINPIGVTWADYDNDGKLDLFIANNNNGNDSLLHNEGEGILSAITAGSIVSSAGNGNGCAWADYDRDGLVDLYVANSDGNNFLFHNNGDGTFARVTKVPMVSATGNSQGCVWVDYDLDGLPDLYVSRYQAVNLLFHNNGDGTFSRVTAGPHVATGGSALGFCWGDYDNDGWPDLFVANGGTNNFLYHNNGDGTFTGTKSPTGADGGGFQTANWIDYDNDGWLDLFVTSTLTSSTCRLYHNNGEGTFTRVTGGALLSDTGRWFAAAWADINNDGFADVLVSNINNPNVLYRNEGNDNHWLTVRCLGRVSNQAAVGAKVRVRATIFGKTFWQYREITTGGNIGNQNQLDPMFGLGDATIVETVQVEWPSGTVQELHNLTVNRILTIKEPARLETVSYRAAGEISLTLRGGKNTIYTIEHSTSAQGWKPWAVITNLTGRVTLNDGMSNDFRIYRAIEQ